MFGSFRASSFILSVINYYETFITYLKLCVFSDIFNPSASAGVQRRRSLGQIVFRSLILRLPPCAVASGVT